MIQCSWAQRVCQEKGVRKLGIEESLRILREEAIKEDMTDLNHMIVVGDLNHRMVEEEDSIENVWIKDQEVDNMREFSQKSGVNRQSCRVNIKERMNVFPVCAATVRRED